ncbi:unnamed protein product [Staurois parvus]|uniref:G-protein coupled receptors family 1 profile domain-containing protein n=1 Tax=Staurois parvus TaxID=386267 RepID=A0ABN9B2R9_9NEOB|nr:unnamed protein product [Staurois parvus]
MGNMLILCVILINPQLHIPMYFFLCILAILDLCISTSVVPRMLSDLISLQKTISIGACSLQCFMILLLSGTESLLLALMGYDRYVAICHPLRYPILMRWSVCYQLTAFCIDNEFHSLHFSTSCCASGSMLSQPGQSFYV